MKRKITTMLLAAMLALTSVASQASAQVETLEVDTYNYYDYTYVNGSRVKINIINEGFSFFGHPDSISYNLYNFNGDLIKQGKVYPNQRLWEGTQWNWDDEFEGEFETDTGGFNLDLWCDGYFNPCEGSATVEVLS